MENTFVANQLVTAPLRTWCVYWLQCVLRRFPASSGWTKQGNRSQISPLSVTPVRRKYPIQMEIFVTYGERKPLSRFVWGTSCGALRVARRITGPVVIGRINRGIKVWRYGTEIGSASLSSGSTFYGDTVTTGKFLWAKSGNMNNRALIKLNREWICSRQRRTGSGCPALRLRLWIVVLPSKLRWNWPSIINSNDNNVH